MSEGVLVYRILYIFFKILQAVVIVGFPYLMMISLNSENHSIPKSPISLIIEPNNQLSKFGTILIAVLVLIIGILASIGIRVLNEGGI